MKSNHPALGGFQVTPDFANFSCQFSAPHQVGRVFSGFCITLPHPNLLASSSPQALDHVITPLVTPTRNRWRCRICPESSPRRQERDRHELSHVPYFMHCPLPHCAWRGNRAGLFKKHWQKEDHRSYYEHYGRTPGQSQIQTFDPWLILNQIISGAISLHDGEVQAIFLVQAKACDLLKPGMWIDPWGRNKTRLMRQQPEALPSTSYAPLSRKT